MFWTCAHTHTHTHCHILVMLDIFGGGQEQLTGDQSKIIGEVMAPDKLSCDGGYSCKYVPTSVRCGSGDTNICSKVCEFI
jgi:hypothetical protein